MAIKLRKTPVSAVGSTASGQTSIYFGVDGVPRVRHETTDTKMLILDGSPVPLRSASTTPVPGYVRLQGQDYGAVTELAATTPSGLVRITRGSTVASPNGGFYTQSQKARQSWYPIAASSTLTQGTGIILSPPVGQWVLYPCRLEYVGTTAVATTMIASLIITTNLLFDNTVGTPDVRLQASIAPLGSGIIATDTLTIVSAQPTVDSSGEIQVTLENLDAVEVAWAESVFAVGPPAILPGAP